MYAPPTVAALPGTGLDLAGVTRLVLDAAVPAFADSAGVFVLEHLLSGGVQAVPPPAGPVIARRLGTRFPPATGQGATEALPAGEVLAFAVGSPCVRCVDNTTPVIFEEPDGATLERIRPGARTVLARYTSFLAAPTVVRGVVTGFLVLARQAGAPPFNGGDVQAAADLAVHAGTGIDDALALARHDLGAAQAPPGSAAIRLELSGLQVAAQCLPSAGCQSGGDWYDVIPLPAGRTGLIIGDVMGHGTEASAAMAQLRTVAHALADLDLPPSEVLRQLNHTTLALPDGTLATCAYAVIDPVGQSCTLGTAGHPPPVLVLRDGTTRVPDLPCGQSLGVGDAGYGQARIRLQPGTVLALYTDGLVETRARPFEDGIRAVRSVLSAGCSDLSAVCDELISTLAEPREDDVTVVLARTVPQ